MIQLREGQRQVAAYRGGALAVPAVPGAGKTTVLAYLASELIEQGCIGTGKILIVTYMTSAVANFKSRIADFLERRGLPKTKGYEIRTLHSLAINIIKERPDRVLLDDEIQIIDEIHRDRIITHLAQSWISQNHNTWKRAIKEPENSRYYDKNIAQWEKKTVSLAKEMIGYFKSRGMSVTDLVDRQAALSEQSFLRWTIEIYYQYQQYLQRAGMIDFDDIIWHAALLLREDKEVLARLQERWTYIFEDEAQDSTPLQEEILHLLAGKEGNLVRVGDSNQAIMGTFTSSEPELFRSFCRHNMMQPILYASRSSHDIIALANYLVKWACTNHPDTICRTALEDQQIQPVSVEDPFPNPAIDAYTIAAPSFATDQEEIQKICHHAIKYAGSNPHKTVAILAPSGSTLQDVATMLQSMGVAFYEITRFPRERQRTAEDVAGILTYLAQPQDNRRLLHILQRFIPELAEDQYHGLCSWLLQEHLENLFFSLQEYDYLAKQPVEFTSTAVWPEIRYVLQNVQGWLEAVYLSPDALVLHIAEQLELSGEEREIAAKIALDMKRRLEQSPALRLDALLHDVDAIKNAANQFANIIFDRRGYAPCPGVINLVTCHKAKGLEWDMVYVISTTANEYPAQVTDEFLSELWFLSKDSAMPAALAKAEMRAILGKSVTNDPLGDAKREIIGERLRLLYVAITRARESLVISSSKQRTKFGNKKCPPAHVHEVLRQYIEKRRLERNEG
jgi:DNA helicase II / ATP-dependent DNA helicase PcrA